MYTWSQWIPLAPDYEVPELRTDVRTVCESHDLENYNSYMSSNWDVLDFFVVIVGLVGVLNENVAVFRALRALRPLRLATRVKQIKVVMGAIVRSLPGMLTTVIFCFMFWFILAIL